MRTVYSLSLSESLAKELESFVRKSGRSKSEVVKEAISDFLWERRFRDSRAVLGRKARKAGIVTDEDVFKTLS